MVSEKDDISSSAASILIDFECDVVVGGNAKSS